MKPACLRGMSGDQRANDSGRIPAIVAHPGSAGSNTAADHLQVLDEAIAALPPGFRRSRQRAERVDGALAAMGLTGAADRLARTYSGGMIRRLELAQALVNAPRLLVLDEPTVGLDPIARTDVWEYITNLRTAADMTVLMTTHYMDEADIYCDRIALMHQARIRAEGTPAELKAALGPDVTLDDVFRHHTGGTLDDEQGGIRDVRRARRTARRLG
jgi:ABC-2 type transport system ATP-binding protein